MFSPQIHIAFNCEEEERITKPVIDNPPNKLHLFTAFIKKTQQKDINMHFYERNIKTLKKEIPLLKIITKEVDYTDYIEIIQELSKIIKNEREENPNCKIFINVSTGSKMASLASSEASRLWDCQIYYVHSTKYEPHGEGPRHKGEFFIFEPATFPIEKPKEIYVRTLKLIDNLISEKYQDKIYDKKKEKFIYLKNLIYKLEAEKYIELVSKHEEPGSFKSALYMKSRNFLEPLVKELKYIKISNDRRNKKVSLTSIGREILKIFKFLI